MAVNYLRSGLIEFGTYPQSRVTARSLISYLGTLPLNWQSYGCSGEKSDGAASGAHSAKSDNYMKYADVTYGTSKFRAVRFTSYRSEDICGEAPFNGIQHNNGYSSGEIYWFRFEPLKWKILDYKTSLVMCLNIIDAQPYSEKFHTHTVSGAYSAANTAYADFYGESSIYKWLNEDFYNFAFNAEEKENTALTVNPELAPFCTQGVKTFHKVFLLSRDEMLNIDYGFSSSFSTYDIGRMKCGSDYSRCRGLEVMPFTAYSQNSRYWLNSDSFEYAVPTVDSNGQVFGRVDSGSTFIGVCPSLHLNRL